MKTNRNISDLEYNFQLKVNAFMEDKKTKELWVFITEWLRTKARQQELYNQWRTTPWRIVTWTLNSKHLSWKAIDIACNRKDLGLYPWINWWNEVFDIAEKYNIISLYRKHWVDKPHLDDWGLPPDEIYKNNHNKMEKLLQEFEENQLELTILSNSNLHKATENNELKWKLAEMNAYLRTLRK